MPSMSGMVGSAYGPTTASLRVCIFTTHMSMRPRPAAHSRQGLERKLATDFDRLT